MHDADSFGTRGADVVKLKGFAAPFFLMACASRMELTKAFGIFRDREGSQPVFDGSVGLDKRIRISDMRVTSKTSPPEVLPDDFWKGIVLDSSSRPC